MRQFNSKTLNAIFIGATFFFVASYVAFSLYITYDLPLGDHWRWIRGLLIPYVEGKISFWKYVTGEFYPFSHSHIITLGLVLANFEWFNLRYDFEFYIGIIATLALLFLLLKTFVNQQQYEDNKPYLYFSILALTSVFINPTNLVSWSLVQLEYLYLLGSVIFLLIVDKSIRFQRNNIILFIATVVMFFVGDAMGVSAIFTAIAFYLLFSTRTHYRQLVLMVIALVVCYWLAQWLIPDMHPHSRSSKFEALRFIAANPLDTMQFVLNSYAQGAIDNRFLQKLGEHKKSVQLSIGALAFLFQLSAVFLSVRYRCESNSYFPLLLIIFCGVSVFGITLSRLPQFGPTYAFGTRYIRLFQFGLLGGLWVYLEMLPRIRGKLSPGILTVTLSVTVMVIFYTATSHYYLWKYRHSRLNAIDTIAEAMVTYSLDDQFDLGQYHSRCKNEFCKSSVEFLSKHKLSLFRPSHPVHEK